MEDTDRSSQQGHTFRCKCRLFYVEIPPTSVQVVDVCVADEHRRKGLGSQMLKELCKDTREKGAQSIAVFTGPSNRLFFWRSGFRLDFRYKVCMCSFKSDLHTEFSVHPLFYNLLDQRRSCR